MSGVFRRAVLAVLAILVAAPVAAAAEVNIYSERQPFLIAPLLDAFTEASGIETHIVYMKQGMLERLKAEGANSPADVILTTNIGNLQDHVDAGLLQSVSTAALEAAIPAQYREPDGRWFALTRRGVIIYAHKERVGADEITSYEDLAKPHMKERVCTRSGKHPYLVNLLAAVIAAKGSEAAEAWAKGLKENLARKPQGNDRAQVKAIYEGECDVSVGNTYYMGQMATNEEKPEQKDWAGAVRIIFPTLVAADGTGLGTHVNVSGIGVTTASQNTGAAVLLMEFLASDAAQEIYAQRNFEYPVKPGVPAHAMVESWGEFRADPTPLSQIAQYIDEATLMMDRIGYDF